MARTMMNARKLDHRYGFYALRHAVWLRNRQPSSANPTSTPFQILQGKKPNLTTLKVFGSDSFVHANDPQRKKFDETARKGVYVGVSRFTGMPMVFMPDTSRVVDGYHARFDETTTPFDVQIDEDSFMTLDSAPAPPAPPPPLPLLLPAAAIRGGARGGLGRGGRGGAVRGAAAAPLRRTPWTTPRVAYEEPPDDVDGDEPRAAIVFTASTSDVPKNITEAFSSADHAEWKAAIDKEMSAMVEHDVWDIVTQADVPPGKKIMQTKIVFDNKLRPSRDARHAWWLWATTSNTDATSLAKYLPQYAHIGAYGWSWPQQPPATFNSTV